MHGCNQLYTATLRVLHIYCQVCFVESVIQRDAYLQDLDTITCTYVRDFSIIFKCYRYWLHHQTGDNNTTHVYSADYACMYHKLCIRMYCIGSE